MKRDYKSYNKEIFQEILDTQYKWNNSISDINIMANELTKSLEESLNTGCPKNDVLTTYYCIQDV
jgi:hypothetical protein